MVPLGKEKEVDAIKAEFGKFFLLKFDKTEEWIIMYVDILTGEKLSLILFANMELINWTFCSSSRRERSGWGYHYFNPLRDSLFYLITGKKE